MRLLLLLCVEAGSVPLLNHLASLPFLATPSGGVSAWRLWLQTTPPDDAVAAVLRLVTTACALWLLATTLLYLVARLGRIPTLGAALARTVPGPVRRLIDAGLTLSVLATLAGPGAAFAATPGPPAPPPAVVVVTGPGGVLIPPGMTPPSPPLPVASPSPSTNAPDRSASPAANPAPAASRMASPRAAPSAAPPDATGPSATAPAPAEAGPTAPAAAERAPGAPARAPAAAERAPGAPARAPAAAERAPGAPEGGAPGDGVSARRDPPVPGPPTAGAYPVRRGDNLWSIAATEVSTRTGIPLPALTDDQIARYWRSLVRLNRPSLRSGNANLIFPGEEISLPPVG